MKTIIGVSAGLLLAGMAWTQPAQAQGTWPGYTTPQTAPAPRYGEPRREPGSGSEMRERCAGLHREAEQLRGRMEREFNPVERARAEGRLRELHEQEERCR